MPKKRRYVSPKTRAKRLADQIIAASVDGLFTKADNAAFMLEATGLVCAAFNELYARCDIMRMIVDGSAEKKKELPPATSLRCPHCSAILLHDDLRVTGTFGGSAEVTAHCGTCDDKVLFGFVDTWSPTD